VFSKQRFFTLIELLVVAIIGILTTFVLVSMEAAKRKARDSAIKSSIIGIRTVAAMSYGSSGNNYDAVCDDAVAGLNGILATTGDFGKVGVVIAWQNGQTPIYCNKTLDTNSTTYTAWSRLWLGMG